MNRKAELEILVEDATNKLSSAHDIEKEKIALQKTRVIAFFSELLGIPKDQLSNTNFDYYSTKVAVKLPGESDFSSAEITVYHPSYSRKVIGLGWFSSGAGMDSVRGERNLLYLEALGKIAENLRTGSEVVDFITDELEIEKAFSKTTKELSASLEDLRLELRKVTNRELIDEGLEMGEIQFDEQGFYASGLEEKITKLTIEKVTDKTITFKYTPINYSMSETKRLKIVEGNVLIREAVKFLKDLAIEKEKV